MVIEKPTLRSLRAENGKTLAEVAKVLNVSVRAVSNYEQGIRRLNIEQIIPLAEYYDESAENVIRAQIESIRIGKP